jgi:hypothetical protein
VLSHRLHDHHQNNTNVFFIVLACFLANYLTSLCSFIVFIHCVQKILATAPQTSCRYRRLATAKSPSRSSLPAIIIMSPGTKRGSASSGSSAKKSRTIRDALLGTSSQVLKSLQAQYKGKRLLLSALSIYSSKARVPTGEETYNFMYLKCFNLERNIDAGIDGVESPDDFSLEQYTNAEVVSTDDE